MSKHVVLLDYISEASIYDSANGSTVYHASIKGIAEWFIGADNGIWLQVISDIFTSNIYFPMFECSGYLCVSSDKWLAKLIMHHRI